MHLSGARSQAYLGSVGSLARRYGVSQDICREALILIEADGLVVLRHGRTGGAYVAPFDPAGFVPALRTALIRQPISGRRFAAYGPTARISQ